MFKRVHNVTTRAGLLSRMRRIPPLELTVALENLDFWASMEVSPRDDRDQVLATFDELAARTRDKAGDADRMWLEQRLVELRRRIELRAQGSGPVPTHAPPGTARSVPPLH